MADEENTDDSSPATVSLPYDVIEIILGFFPITQIPNAALVCKQWQSFVTSSPLLRSISDSINKSKPWLFVLGSNNNKSMGYDPLARRWVRLPTFSFSSKEEFQSTRVGNGGFLFSIAGGRLKFKQSFLNASTWQETTASMKMWRRNPVVCYNNQYSRIFVIGGVFEFEEHPLCVEMYDLCRRSWEMCDPLPEELKHSASSTWLSSADINGKIYVVEKYRGDCCCFDLENKRWGSVVKLRPAPLPCSCQLVRYYCLGCSRGLILAQLMREEGWMSLRMWVVDENTMECKVNSEIRMPSEMLQSLIGSEEEEDELLYGEEIDCRGVGDLIYVFGNWSYGESRVVCLYDLNQGVWEVLPKSMHDDDFEMNWRQRALFVCCSVTLDENIMHCIPRISSS